MDGDIKLTYRDGPHKTALLDGIFFDRDFVEYYFITELPQLYLLVFEICLIFLTKLIFLYSRIGYI